MRAMSRDAQSLRARRHGLHRHRAAPLTDDLAAIQQALRNKIEQMPGFFQDAPVALDLSALEGTDDDDRGRAPAQRRESRWRSSPTLLRELKLVPVGIRHLREARRAEARAAGLGILRGTGRKPAKSQPKEPDASQAGRDPRPAQTHAAPRSGAAATSDAATPAAPSRSRRRHAHAAHPAALGPGGLRRAVRRGGARRTSTRAPS